MLLWGGILLLPLFGGLSAGTHPFLVLVVSSLFLCAGFLILNDIFLGRWRDRAMHNMFRWRVQKSFYKNRVCLFASFFFFPLFLRTLARAHTHISS